MMLSVLLSVGDCLRYCYLLGMLCYALLGLFVSLIDIPTSYYHCCVGTCTGLP